MELAPAPVTCSPGDLVSHDALSGPPVVEQAVAAGVVLWAAGAAGVVEDGAALVAAVVVVDAAVVEVVVLAVVLWCLAAVGADEPHAEATSATATAATMATPERLDRRRSSPRTTPVAPCSTTPTPLGYGAPGVRRPLDTYSYELKRNTRL